MTAPFFNRLKQYYAKVGEVLRGEASAASIFPNATDIGTSKERIYKEMLKQHLPSSCNIMLGGFLFNQDGNVSKQIDIIITNDSSLQFNFLNPDGTGKSFACIDGCVGVVCVKTRLDSTQLVNSLANIASIPEKQPLTPERHSPMLKIKRYDEWPYKIIYASDGIRLETLMDSLNEYFIDHADIPLHKRPNLLHVAGKYVITRVEAEGGERRNGTSIEPNTFYPMIDTTDVYGLVSAILGIQVFALTSQHVTYRYDTLLNKIPF